MREVSPDYVITTSADAENQQAPGSEGFRFFQALHGGDTEFELVLDHQGRVPLLLFDPHAPGVRSNLDKVNPRIRVFARTSLGPTI